MIIPWTELAETTLRNLIEDYVTREGTEYGHQETPLDTRVAQVWQHLERGEAVVWFDEDSDTVNILRRQDLPAGAG
jgi:uncharacterized protein YheU (UPF0270 family)